MEIRCDQDLTPPSGLFRHIRSALKCIDDSNLQGIGFVLLFDDIPELSKREDQDVIMAIQSDLAIFGAYRARSPTAPAHIILIVRSLYHPIPAAFWQTTAMTLRIAQTVAHEVGHHLIAEKRFALRPKAGTDVIENEEEFAERYAHSVITRMKSSFRYEFGNKLLKLAAAIDYYKGSRAWKKGRYDAAADYFDMTNSTAARS